MMKRIGAPFRQRVSMAHTSLKLRLKKENYLEMLQNFFLRRHCLTNCNNYYFQQDGATPHTADMVQNWLCRQFGKYFVNKKKWPPRSPDLNPCDFYL
jgi:hypothetical protein